MTYPLHVRNKHRTSFSTARRASGGTAILTPFLTYAIMSGVLTDWMSFWPILSSVMGTLEDGLNSILRSLNDARSVWAWAIVMGVVWWAVPLLTAVSVYVVMRLALLPAVAPIARTLNEQIITATPPTDEVQWIDGPRINRRGELQFRLETRIGGVVTVPGPLGGAENIAVTDQHGATLYGYVILRPLNMLIGHGMRTQGGGLLTDTVLRGDCWRSP